MTPTTPQHPSVTVVIVSYNHASFVEEALESVRAQTTPPQQVIIVDDASSDATADVVREWLRRAQVDYRFVAHETNTGLCAALNEALALVSSDLYTYMSADDRMAPARLERQVQRWVQDGASAVAVYSNARRIDESGREIRPDYRTEHHWPDADRLEGRIHTDLLRHCWLPAASVVVSTDAVRRVGGYDERWFFEDYDLWLRLSATGRILCVDEPLVDFREVQTSLGHQRFNAEDVGFLEARVGIFLKQVGVSSEGDAYIREAMTPLALRLWKLGGDPDLVRDALEAAERIDGSPTLRLRLLLLRRGVRRQPRVLSSAERAVQQLRECVRGRG